MNSPSWHLFPHPRTSWTPPPPPSILWFNPPPSPPPLISLLSHPPPSDLHPLRPSPPPLLPSNNRVTTLAHLNAFDTVTGFFFEVAMESLQESSRCQSKKKEMKAPYGVNCNCDTKERRKRGGLQEEEGGRGEKSLISGKWGDNYAIYFEDETQKIKIEKTLFSVPRLNINQSKTTPPSRR